MNPCLTKLIDRVICYEWWKVDLKERIVIRMHFFLSSSDFKAKFLERLGSDCNKFNWFRKLYYSGISYQNLRLISCRVVEIWFESRTPLFFASAILAFLPLAERRTWNRTGERKRNTATMYFWSMLVFIWYTICVQLEQVTLLLSIRGGGGIETTNRWIDFQLMLHFLYIRIYICMQLEKSTFDHSSSFFFL